MSNRGSMYHIYNDVTFHVDLTRKTDRIDYISAHFRNPTSTLRKAVAKIPSSVTYSLDYGLRKVITCQIAGAKPKVVLAEWLCVVFDGFSDCYA